MTELLLKVGGTTIGLRPHGRSPVFPEDRLAKRARKLAKRLKKRQRQGTRLKKGLSDYPQAEALLDGRLAPDLRDWLVAFGKDAERGALGASGIRRERFALMKAISDNVAPSDLRRQLVELVEEIGAAADAAVV
jgi:hypothetical protein